MSKKLSILKKNLGKIVLKNEMLLLNKWIYKNKNQHRRADYFKKIYAVQRHWKKYVAIGLVDWIKEYMNNPNLSVKEGCFKMFHAFALLENMQTRVMIAYVAFRRQVELTYFMSVSLFAMGILARIHYIIQDLLDKIQDAYQELKDSSVKLPNTLSLLEFTNWNSRKTKDENKKIVLESESSSSDNETVKTRILDKSCLSDEFWSKSGSNVSLNKRKSDDVQKKIKKDSKSLKNNDLDIIFGKLK